MKIAYSPCPNDTFIYYAWTHGLLDNCPPPEVVLADIDVTNKMLLDGTGLDVMKISFAALPYALHDYNLLHCGGALGRGCGPLLLSKTHYSDAKELIGKTIAVPSLLSTAFLLMRFWLDNSGLCINDVKIETIKFSEIMPLLAKGNIDAGLVIHEARFTYNEYDLNAVIDLGEWWEKTTDSPIPLGAIIAKKNLDNDYITNCIKKSLSYAWANPELTMNYMKTNAQELTEQVIKQHVDLYVNEYSMNLGKDGQKAVDLLLNKAKLL